MTVLDDWDKELDPVAWCVVSLGSNGEGGKKGKKGKKRKREQEGGTFRVAGGLLFLTREEAEAHLREALGAGDDGDSRNDGDDEGNESGDKGEGGDKGGEVGGDEGGEKEADMGFEKGVSRAQMSPGKPPPRRRGNLRVATREWGPGGGRGANRANWVNQATPPPSDLATARQVAFQMTYGVRWGANRTNRGSGGGGDPALRESGIASGPCDWPQLAMVAGAASLRGVAEHSYVLF